MRILLLPLIPSAFLHGFQAIRSPVDLTHSLTSIYFRSSKSSKNPGPTKRAGEYGYSLCRQLLFALFIDSIPNIVGLSVNIVALSRIGLVVLPKVLG